MSSKADEQKYQSNPQCLKARDLAKEFATAYYGAFATGPANCAKFYQDASKVSFEGENFKGLQAIQQNLSGLATKLPAGSKHEVTSTDGQPSIAMNGAFLVYVTANFVGQKMQEVFHLVPTSTGSFYIHNDIFRIANNNQINAPDDEGGEVAKAFLEHFVKVFDTDRGSLASLFRPTSVLTFEGSLFIGQQEICERLGQLPQVQHNTSSLKLDCQSVNGKAIILVNMSGELTIDGNNALKFTEVFQLVQDGGAYYVGNMIYRLNYG